MHSDIEPDALRWNHQDLAELSPTSLVRFNYLEYVIFFSVSKDYSVALKETVLKQTHSHKMMHRVISKYPLPISE